MIVTPDWLTAPGPRAVFDLLSGAGFAVHAVGGAVRDAVLGRTAPDIDFATNADPQRVADLAGAAGLRVVMTGLDHGTVTLVLDGQGYEVTTWRHDLRTDGRRAQVAWAGSLAEDAARRDFTMNALYLDAAGVLTDPTGGLADLLAGLVRFIGDADARIAEDYLRILRFFRFHAWYGPPGAAPDPDGLAACARGLDGIARLSAERLGAEMLRLCAAPDPAPTIAAMARIGVLAAVLPLAAPGDPTATRPEALSALIGVEHEAGIAPRALRRLFALGGDDPVRALRLSRAQGQALRAIRQAMARPDPAVAAQLFGPDAALDAALIQAAQGAQPLPADLHAEIARGAAAHFGVRAADLLHHYPPGPALGAELARLHALWCASGLRLDRAALLAAIRPA